MCQEANVCRGSAWNENLESLQVEWKRKTISHCNLIPPSNYVPFVVPGLSTNSSTAPSPTSSSSSQNSVLNFGRYIENPVPERSGSTSEELRGNPLHESTETGKKK